jgi:DNA-directed RNA polymerase specialized sigma24 family protein
MDQDSLHTPPAPSTSEEAFVRTMGCRTMLKAFIFTIVKDAHLAEDTFQDTVLIIAGSWSKFDRNLSFEAWARKIARNQALANLRKFKRPVLELDDDVIESLSF